MAVSGSRPTADSSSAVASREWFAPYRVDLSAVLGPFQHGRFDPTVLTDGSGGLWRTTLTPEGPSTMHLALTPGTADALVRASAWGPGALWALDRMPALLGADDDPRGFPEDLLPERLRTRWALLSKRWRVPQSERVIESVVSAVLEQKVTGVESRRNWSSLVGAIGEVAPGPTPRPMRVFPEPAAIAMVPSWQWHAWGVQPAQSATIMRAVAVAGRLEECSSLPLPAARRRVRAVDGCGPWTVAEVAHRALGDADSVSFGDFHLAGQVVYAFTGAIDGTDEQMERLLEPFAGHRYRVQRLVETAGITKPARGPRATITDHRGR